MDKGARYGYARRERTVTNARLSEELVWRIKEYITNDQWSPRQISGYLRRNEGIKVSHQSIYNIIHNDTTGKLAMNTRHKMKYRHRPKCGCLPIKDRVSIHERSKEVDGKRFGDFEMDLIVDPDQQAILTLVEKSTNMLLMQKLPFGKQSKPLAKVVRKLMLTHFHCTNRSFNRTVLQRDCPNSRYSNQYQEQLPHAPPLKP